MMPNEVQYSRREQDVASTARVRLYFPFTAVVLLALGISFSWFVTWQMIRTAHRPPAADFPRYWINPIGVGAVGSLLSLLFFLASRSGHNAARRAAAISESSQRESSTSVTGDITGQAKLQAVLDDATALISIKDEQLKESIAASERTLRELEFYKYAIDAVAIVAATDASGKIIHANDKFCQISKYAREELLRQDHRMVNSGHHTKAFWREMYASISTGELWHGEIKNRAKDGTIYWVDTTVVPFMNERGRIDRYVAIRSDITARKRAEDELLKANQELTSAKESADAANEAKSAFLANMSHEIRTPMAAILGYADLLLGAAGSGTGTGNHYNELNAIRRNGKHLLQLINDILDLSKIEAGKMAIEAVSAPLLRLAAEAASMTRPTAVEKGLSLELRFESPIPRTIWIDPLRLRQILVNLLGNAVKFTEQGSVVLSLSSNGPGDDVTVDFAIRDTGIGMTAEHVSRLFQPFGQADTSTTRRFGGTGLGLVISRRLAELIGGTITVQSEPGVGTTFTLSVRVGPVAPEHFITELAEVVVSRNESAETRDATIEQTLTGMRILLAEDGADNREILARYLQAAGAAVLAAENGRMTVDEAVFATAKGHPFDVILMDMQMPVLDGYGATHELRGLGYTGRIIALTAHAMTDDRTRCLAAGCDDYLTKPIESQALVAAILGATPGHPGHEGSNRGAGPTLASTGGPTGPIRSSLSGDPRFADLLDQFVARLPLLVGEIVAYQDAAMSDAVFRVAHQLKGSAGTFGFPRISVAASAVVNRLRVGEQLSETDADIRAMLGLIRTVEGYDPAAEASVANYSRHERTGAP